MLVAIMIFKLFSTKNWKFGQEEYISQEGVAQGVKVKIFIVTWPAKNPVTELAIYAGPCEVFDMFEKIFFLSQSFSQTFKKEYISQEGVGQGVKVKIFIVTWPAASW